jgi:hypothetical protein
MTTRVKDVIRIIELVKHGKTGGPEQKDGIVYTPIRGAKLSVLSLSLSLSVFIYPENFATSR